MWRLTQNQLVKMQFNMMQRRSAMKDLHVNTDAKVRNDGVKRMPHERDEAPDAQSPKPRSVMKQAAADVESGMVDTDLHNKPGVEKVKTPTPREATAQPQPNVKRD
jgi:hypothetical protein